MFGFPFCQELLDVDQGAGRFPPISRSYEFITYTRWYLVPGGDSLLVLVPSSLSLFAFLLVARFSAYLCAYSRLVHLHSLIAYLPKYVQ